MAYKSVQWSEGEPIIPEKIIQMTDNDEEIRRLLFLSSQGVLGRAIYDGASGNIDNASAGSLVSVCSVSNIVIPTGRWIKVSVCVPQIVSTGSTVCPGVQVRQTSPSTVDVLHLWALGDSPQCISGSRVLYAKEGTYTYVLYLANDTAQNAGTSRISSISPQRPVIMTVEDIGGKLNGI